MIHNYIIIITFQSRNLRPKKEKPLHMYNDHN